MNRRPPPVEKFVTVGISVPNEVSDKSVGVSGVEDKDMRLHTQMNIHTQQNAFPWAVNACLHVIERVEDDSERTGEATLMLPGRVGQEDRKTKELHVASWMMDVDVKSQV